MGTHYKGNSPTYRSLKNNLGHTTNKYNYSDGYFGKKGKSSKNSNRQIDCANPKIGAKSFYDLIAYGGIEQVFDGGNRRQTKLKDGTIITYREITSTVNSPAVQINIKNSNDPGGVKTQKIHFEKEKEDEYNK